MKGTNPQLLLHLLHHWHLMQIQFPQMWPVTGSLLQTQRERTMTARTEASCQTTKQVKAPSPVWRGFTSPPSCPRERPAHHTRAQRRRVTGKTSPLVPLPQRAGGAAPPSKTRPALHLSLPRSPKTGRSQPRAKASLLPDNRVRMRQSLPVRVQASLRYPGRAPPRWRPDASDMQRAGSLDSVTASSKKLLWEEDGKRLKACH